MFSCLFSLTNGFGDGVGKDFQVVSEREGFKFTVKRAVKRVTRVGSRGGSGTLSWKPLSRKATFSKTRDTFLKFFRESVPLVFRESVPCFWETQIDHVGKGKGLKIVKFCSLGPSQGIRQRRSPLGLGCEAASNPSSWPVIGTLSRKPLSRKTRGHFLETFSRKCPVHFYFFRESGFRESVLYPNCWSRTAWPVSYQSWRFAPNNDKE